MINLESLARVARMVPAKEGTSIAEKIQHARVSAVVGEGGAGTLVSRMKKRIEIARFIARMGITIAENPKLTAGLPRAKPGSTKAL